MKNTHGTLYLIPAPLGEDARHTIPEFVVRQMHELDTFIVERAKTARHFIRDTKPPRPIAEMQFYELNEHTQLTEKEALLNPLLAGEDVGLMSEAGCPGVADPGAELVKLAHQKGIKVKPLVGPSSILLALMASGMNGQQFCFQGYLTAKKDQLGADLKRLEQLSSKARQTQIFIEAPYRNNAVFETALKVLNPATLLCVATDITLPAEKIQTKSIAAWKQMPPPDLHKRPTVFLLLA